MVYYKLTHTVNTSFVLNWQRLLRNLDELFLYTKKIIMLKNFNIMFIILT